ncbi:MAG: hypothetical protein WA771_08025 [Chthoniobacterales bacterium]
MLRPTPSEASLNALPMRSPRTTPTPAHVALREAHAALEVTLDRDFRVTDPILQD